MWISMKFRILLLDIKELVAAVRELRQEIRELIFFVKGGVK